MSTGATSAVRLRLDAAQPGEEHESLHFPARGTHVVPEQRAGPERSA